MSTMKSAFLFVLVAGLISLLAACQTAQPNVKNSFGTVTGFVDANPQSVADAASKALREHGYAEVSQNVSDGQAKVIGRTKDDTKIEITAKKMGDRVSKLDIHYGAFGNEDRSLELYDTIQKAI